MDAITWVDWFLIGVIALSTIISMFRGFTREIFSLLTWLIAILVAVHFTPALSVWLESHIGSDQLRIITAFCALFIVTIILGSLINYAVGQLIHGSGLSGTDRLLGSLFGIARGVLVSVILIIGAGLTPLVDSPVWKNAKLVPAFEPVTLWMLSFVPQEATMAWLKELNMNETKPTSTLAAPPKALTQPKPPETQPSSPAHASPQTSQNPGQSAPTFSYPGKVQPSQSTPNNTSGQTSPNTPQP